MGKRTAMQSGHGEDCGHGGQSGHGEQPSKRAAMESNNHRRGPAHVPQSVPSLTRSAASASSASVRIGSFRHPSGAASKYHVLISFGDGHTPAMPWVKLLHPNQAAYPGVCYWFNEDTFESVWDKPDGAPDDISSPGTNPIWHR